MNSTIRYKNLKLNNYYKVTDLTINGRAREKLSKVMRLKNIENHMLLFEDELGVRECFLNHIGLVYLEEV